MGNGDWQAVGEWASLCGCTRREGEAKQLLALALINYDCTAMQLVGGCPGRTAPARTLRSALPDVSPDAFQRGLCHPGPSPLSLGRMLRRLSGRIVLSEFRGVVFSCNRHFGRIRQSCLSNSKHHSFTSCCTFLRSTASASRLSYVLQTSPGRQVLAHRAIIYKAVS